MGGGEAPRLLSAPARRRRNRTRLLLPPLSCFLRTKSSFGGTGPNVATKLVKPVQFCRKGLSLRSTGGQDTGGSRFLRKSKLFYKVSPLLWKVTGIRFVTCVKQSLVLG